MPKFSKKRIKRLLGLFFITLGILIAIPSFIGMLSYNSPTVINKDNNNNEIDDLIKMPNTASAYSPSSSGSGGQFNISLQESYWDNTPITFSDLDVSNKFSTPAPKYPGFNTSFVNMTIKNIQAPNKSLTIEDSGTSSNRLTYQYWSSFQIKGSGYLTNVSIDIETAGSTTFYLYIYNSTNSGSIIYDTDLNGGVAISSATVSGTTPQHWLNFTSLHFFLNADNSYNKTFFISIGASGTNGFWYSEDQSNGDNTIVYDIYGLRNIDMNFKVGLAPIDNSPNPEDINMAINNIKVNGYKSINGSGYWNTTTDLLSDYSSHGFLNFTINADWWDVSCDITEVQINYTKSDLYANSTFMILKSGGDIQWNITTSGGLNYFDKRINHTQTINYTIPSSWTQSSIKVYNGSLSNKFSPSIRDLNNGWYDVMVKQGGNGTNWFLLANSTNLLNNIETRVNGINLSEVNYTNTVNFYGVFSEVISNGEINLTVYSPDSSGNYENFSYYTSTISKNTNISLSSWNIQENATNYGPFRMQVFWRNSTEAGFLEQNLTINAETELNHFVPKDRYFSKDIFQIKLHYNDTGQNLNITNANLKYSINGGVYRTDNITEVGNGNYTIEIYCNDTQFTKMGFNSIQINASKNYYNYALTTFNFIKLRETTALIAKDPDQVTYYSDTHLNMTITYQDHNGSAIEGATMDVFVNGNPLSITQWSGGPGSYEALVNFNNSLFQGYGNFNIRVDINKTYYENQTQTFSITVIGNTNANFAKVPDQTTYYSDTHLNMTITYQDHNGSAIEGATMDVFVNGNPLSITQWSNGPGLYEALINFNNSLFQGYGTFNIRVDINKTYYEGHTQIFSITIIGNTNANFAKVPDQTTYYSDTHLNMTITYQDHNGSAIEGATMDVFVNGNPLSITQWSNGPGLYEALINFNNSLFQGYGTFNIRVDINKTYYEGHTQIFSITVIGNTNAVFIKDPDLPTYDSDTYLNMTITYQDHNGSAIEGAAMDVFVNGNPLSITQWSNGPGLYEALINFNDLLFKDYGTFNIRVDINKTYYEGHTQIFSITVVGKTNLSYTMNPDKRTYSSSDIFNISVNFENVANSSYISGASVTLKLNDSDYTPLNIDYVGNGTYIIEINCSTNDFFPYGDFSLLINLTKINYYYSSTTIIFGVAGETSLTITSPSPGSVYNSLETFNITVYYNDTLRDLGIYGATFTIQISGNPYTPISINDHNNGTYDIEFNCSDSQFYTSGWGIKNIQITASKANYSDSIDSISIQVNGQTEFTIISPSIDFNYDANESFQIQLTFQDIIQGYSAITGATITYSLDGGITNRTGATYMGGSYYITVDCNDSDFNYYGNKNIIVYAQKQYYEGKSDSFSIKITGLTDLILQNPSQGSTYNSSESIKIQLFFNDTVKDEGISGAIINYSLNGGTTFLWRNVQDYNNGTYIITIDCTNPDFNYTGTYYGLKNIIIQARKQYYYNETNLPLNINIRGETSLSLSKSPDKVFYASNETLNLEIYFNDTARDEGISSASISYRIGSNGIRNDNIQNFGNGTYIITLYCNDLELYPYSQSLITVYANKTNYYNQSQSISVNIKGQTFFEVISPEDKEPFVYGQTFNITVLFTDVSRGSGVSASDISYIIDGTTFIGNQNVTEIGNGYYVVTIYVNDSSFVGYGYRDIIINISKQHYVNQSITYTFLRQRPTQISPSYSPNLGSVLRGLNVTYTFEYSDINSTLISNANMQIITDTLGFKAYLQVYGNGTFKLHIDTTGVEVSAVPYNLLVNISAYKYQTQILNLTIDVQVIRTEIVNVNYLSEIARNSGLNQTVRFYFNDTTNNLPVLNLNTSNVRVYNNATGELWNTNDFNWRLRNPSNNGTYFLDISLNNLVLDSGWYTLKVNVSNFPNYDLSICYVKFYYRGNYTNVGLMSMEYDTNGLAISETNSSFTMFEDNNIWMVFNITDKENNNSLLLKGNGETIQYFVYYQDLANLSNNGILINTLSYDANTYTYKGVIQISGLPTGNYNLSVIVVKTNYENSTYNFTLTIQSKHEVRIRVLSVDSKVKGGESFNLAVIAEYNDGNSWNPLTSTTLTATIYFDGIAQEQQLTRVTNATGGVLFTIQVPIDKKNVTVGITINSTYSHLNGIFQSQTIQIIPPSRGPQIEDFLIYFILGFIAIGAVAGSVGIYRGVVVPRKREKQRVLKEVKTIFEDAINLEHILVLYKGSGTCIFFKSYGTEEIDPELISGFISAVSSFGREMESQMALNEITYGDKMLLLADGVYIRVALVLGKKASIILRQHLKQFINAFEQKYTDILPSWRGQLKPFHDAGHLVDEILNTSIILPHELSYEIKQVKGLKNPHSRDILNVAMDLKKESGRNFFFIATLIEKATEDTNKDIAEIFMGVKELRDTNILSPIEISAIEEQPISQQEMNLIQKKVTELTDLGSDEEQKLINDLAQMGLAEREAYISSLIEQQEIVSAPIRSKIGGKLIEDEKTAKKEIKKLEKRADKEKKSLHFHEAIDIYKNAAMIATSWDFNRKFEELEDIIRLIQIEDLELNLEDFETQAKRAAKKKNYEEAAQKYKSASKMASEIFKLGGANMTKEVKKLTNKAKEYEKLSQEKTK